VRSILFWLFPYGTHSWRNNPWFTLWVFLMHIGLLLTPVFLVGHNVLMRERLGISLWTMPDGLADFLTIAVIVSVIFLTLRRIALPEVRLMTTAYDYLLLAIAVAPFITGFIAFHGASDYRFWIIAHVLSGEIFLVAIPLTKLSHFILFFLSRAQLGMDYGIKRGGMKNKGIAW
jgi:nitrate reductase gamma subunit